MTPRIPPLVPRLALAALVGHAGLRLAHAATGALGRAVSTELRGHARGALVWPVCVMIGQLLLLLVLAFAWSRRRPLRPGLERVVVSLAVMTTVVASYAWSLRSGGHEFHGLLTPPPHTQVEDRTPTRPPTITTLNAHGFRGDEWQETKPAGVTRVAVVGDSFVFGSGVKDEETLPRLLAEELTARAPGRHWEVLNLGIPGDNVASHVTMVDVASRALGADVVVLCLILPNDLSRWDEQLPHQRRRAVGGYSLVAWLLGDQAASAIWGSVGLEREITPAGEAWLAKQAERLAALRRGQGAAPPLLVFRYYDSSEGVPAMATLPNARGVLGPTDRPEMWIEGDGHPTAEGNLAFAAPLVDAILAAVDGP